MFKNKITLLSFLVISSSLMVACGKTEDVKEDTKVGSVENAKKEEINTVEVTPISAEIIKSSSDLKSFSKAKIKEFENILKSNKIDCISTEDSSLVINKNMSYEKYTKEFSQLAYRQVYTNYENGTGYLKTGIKINIHLQEQASTENNFVKAMFDIVKLHNPNITEESFNEEIKNATSSSENISDKDITTGVDGLIIKVYSKPDINEREIVLSIRQELEIPKSENLLKEYKTVQEFKDDSEKLNTIISEKIENVNEVLKNSYIGKFKEVNFSTKGLVVDTASSFNQSIEVEYKGTEINDIQDEVLVAFYEIIESIITKEKLSKIVTLDEFKSYIKSLKVYSGEGINGVIIDELGDYIQPSRLPLVNELGINMSYVESSIKEESKKENAEESKSEGKVDINKYDAYIKITVSIPVKAEGITNL